MAERHGLKRKFDHLPPPPPPPPPPPSSLRTAGVSIPSSYNGLQPTALPPAGDAPVPSSYNNVPSPSGQIHRVKQRNMGAPGGSTGGNRPIGGDGLGFSSSAGGGHPVIPYLPSEGYTPQYSYGGHQCGSVIKNTDILNSAGHNLNSQVNWGAHGASTIQQRRDGFMQPGGYSGVPPQNDQQAYTNYCLSSGGQQTGWDQSLDQHAWQTTYAAPQKNTGNLPQSQSVYGQPPQIQRPHASAPYGQALPSGSAHAPYGQALPPYPGGHIGGTVFDSGHQFHASYQPQYEYCQTGWGQSSGIHYDYNIQSQQLHSQPTDASSYRYGQPSLPPPEFAEANCGQYSYSQPGSQYGDPTCYSNEGTTSVASQCQLTTELAPALDNSDVYKIDGATLDIATEGADKIGMGGFGIVYKASIDGIDVAVKFLTDSGLTEKEKTQLQRQFNAETQVLSKVQHQNLVRLIKSCEEKLAIVYEFMPNGSLDGLLNGAVQNFKWRRRIEVAISICKALIHLHSHPQPIVHGDLTPSNVLFDHANIAKLSDFGLCRILQQVSTSGTVMHLTANTPQGTPGYVDPHYMKTRELTTSSDTYSFGIILLQLVTGKCAVDLRRYLHEMLIPHQGLWRQTNNRETLEKNAKIFRRLGLVQKHLDIPKGDILDGLEMIKLGLRCSSKCRGARSNLSEVLPALELFHEHSMQIKDKGQHKEHHTDLREFLELNARKRQMVESLSVPSLEAQENIGDA